MAKYNSYIELSPHYESVVSIETESNHPDMWQEYIVHEDMKGAIEKICDSLKFEDEDKRRSFWIHGAYGTGKSYAAIVLKHLFEDKVDSIRKFLSNQMLIQYRERFLSIREKGDFLVIWKSQATDIKSGIQLMMTMEDAIRDKLKEKYGDSAYYGKKSLVAAAKEAVNDSSINWDELFMNQSYALYEEYGSVEDFRDEVNAGNLKAANVVARIYRDKGWGFFTSLQMFKDWVGDVIEGNNLQDTGIIFIWDEFTSYLRNNPTDDVLQPLSEFCKEQPFFMFLIVHRAPSWVSQIGEEVYEQIVHRYHSLDFHVSESAAYELIGSSILTRAGMEEQWNAEKDNAEDGGHRKFIMVQLPEATDEKSEARKAGYKTICEIGKERIRRAGKKIKEDSPLTTQDLDIGFRVLKCDTSNMKEVYYNPAEYEASLFSSLEEKLFVSELQYTTTIGRQKTEMNEYEIERGASFTGEKTRTQTLKHAETSQIKYDLIGKIAEGTVLTRRTVSAILQGIRVDKLYMFKNNPEEFITKVIRLINEQKATMIVEHISYDAIEGEYDSSIFTAEKATQSFDKAFLAKKAIQDYVFTDGSADKSIERKFAEDLDAADEVCVYAKLPRTFQIPTPVGNYSPDWAIAFYEGKVKHIFFIAETKGTMESLELRPIEQAKISCAKKLFNEMSTSNVVYHDVDSYQSLLNIMNSL